MLNSPRSQAAHWRRLIARLLGSALLIGLVVSSASISLASEGIQAIAPAATLPTIHANFPVALNGALIRSSSIALGDLNGDGVSDIVVGGSDGKVHAYTGSGSKLWEYDTGNMAIESKPAIADINKDGKNEVVVGAGSTFTPQAHGGVYVLSNAGALRCSFQTNDFNRDGWRDGVYSSPALADIDQSDGGRLEIVFGGYDAYVRILNDDCSVVKEKFVYDTVWSSPAIGDLNSDGKPEIVIGVDSHVDPGKGTYDGGILHAYDSNLSDLPGFPKQIDEVIYSSPALGDIDGDGYLDIVVGTGQCYNNVPACAPGGRVHPGVGEYINAWDHNGNYLPGWPKTLNNTYAFASPALANMDSDPLPEVIVNTADAYVHVLNGNGSEVSGWPKKPLTPPGVSFASTASPIAADLDGDGSNEIVLPSNWELVAWNKSGLQLTRTQAPPLAGQWTLDTKYSINGAPAAGDIDGDGKIELVVGGAYNSTGAPGGLYAWDFAGAATATSLPWPAFRRDAGNHAILIAPGLRSTATQITILLGPNDSRSVALSLRDAAGGAIGWTASENLSWLTVSPASGSTPGTLTLTASSNGLATGEHTGQVTLTSSINNLTIDVRAVVADKLYASYVPGVRR